MQKLRVGLRPTWKAAPFNGTTCVVRALLCKAQRLDERTRMKTSNERGASGWLFLWLIGIPVPLLLLLFFARGCT
jgi:hypothetical protein